MKKTLCKYIFIRARVTYTIVTFCFNFVTQKYHLKFILLQIEKE